MTRVLTRVSMWLALALATGLLAHATPADAAPAPGFVAVGHSPTKGTPVPGAYLTADFGMWTSPPESYEFQWFRDGAPIAGRHDAGLRRAGRRHRPHDRAQGDRPLRPGHRRLRRRPRSSPARSAPRSPSTSGASTRPGRKRLVWMAISFMTTERPWAHRRRHRHGVQGEGRPAQGARPRGRDPRRGLRPAAVEARAARQHLRDGLLRRLRRGRGRPARRSTSCAGAPRPRQLTASRTSPAPPRRNASRSSAPAPSGITASSGAIRAAGRRGCTAPPARARPARRR